jgi:hypothetical protein
MIHNVIYYNIFVFNISDRNETCIVGTVCCIQPYLTFPRNCTAIGQWCYINAN